MFDLDWADFKGLVKDWPRVFYKTRGNSYYICYFDGGLETSVADGSSDYTDFSDNFKPLCMSAPLPVSKQIQILGDDNYRLFGCATTFTATKTTTTTHNFLIPTNVVAIKGANAFYVNPAIGDYVKVSMVDVDNVLGYGSGTVLGTFIDKWYTPPSGLLFIDNVSISIFPVPGLYLKFEYVSVGTVNDVDVFCNFISYEAT